MYCSISTRNLDFRGDIFRNYNIDNDNVNVTLLEYLITVFCTLGRFFGPWVEYQVPFTYNISTCIVLSNRGNQSTKAVKNNCRQFAKVHVDKRNRLFWFDCHWSLILRVSFGESNHYIVRDLRRHMASLDLIELIFAAQSNKWIIFINLYTYTTFVLYSSVHIVALIMIYGLLVHRYYTGLRELIIYHPLLLCDMICYGK